MFFGSIAAAIMGNLEVVEAGECVTGSTLIGCQGRCNWFICSPLLFCPDDWLLQPLVSVELLSALAVGPVVSVSQCPADARSSLAFSTIALKPSPPPSARPGEPRLELCYYWERHGDDPRRTTFERVYMHTCFFHNAFPLFECKLVFHVNTARRSSAWTQVSSRHVQLSLRKCLLLCRCLT